MRAATKLRPAEKVSAGTDLINLINFSIIRIAEHNLELTIALKYRIID